ncbi:ribonuclease HII [Campylobacter geochelonis]|uniref:Ribonuclease HII n=2 Tax=Campylobacter geochelonis TaxID=1780362 RepID=A0A128EC29_9BACT|nr:ribonuclease HII [Campylobacter geochelonis]
MRDSAILAVCIKYLGEKMDDLNRLCGIDEAGRGALAGDLYMAGCILKVPIIGLDDSKKLSEKKREKLYDEIVKNSEFLVLNFSNLQIDELGLSKCLKMGLEAIKSHFKECDFIFDGNTNFGVSGLKTLIKADAQIPAVSAASVLAKVSRDRAMKALSPLYPNYGFEKHKGYGTKFHTDMIAKFGQCEIHRKSFVLKCFEPTLFG